MAKRNQGMGWKSIVVIIVVLAMVLTLIGLDIFSTTQPTTPSNTQTSQPSVSDIQVQTQGGGSVNVNPTK